LNCNVFLLGKTSDESTLTVKQEFTVNRSGEANSIYLLVPDVENDYGYSHLISTNHVQRRTVSRSQETVREERNNQWPGFRNQVNNPLLSSISQEISKRRASLAYQESDDEVDAQITTLDDPENIAKVYLVQLKKNINQPRYVKQMLEEVLRGNCNVNKVSTLNTLLSNTIYDANEGEEATLATMHKQAVQEFTASNKDAIDNCQGLNEALLNLINMLDEYIKDENIATDTINMQR